VPSNTVPSNVVSKLGVQVINSLPELEQREPEWTELWSRCAVTPFQSPAWLLPWWRHVGEGELLTLTLRLHGRLVGVAPLYIYPHPQTSVRHLFLLGTGTTDYLDALFEEGLEHEGTVAVLTGLDELRDQWDVCDFQQLRPGSPLTQVECPSGWTDVTSHHEPCPVLRLSDTVEGLDGCLPARIQQNVRYYWRRAQKAGEVSVERATEGTLEMFLGELLRLHQARWQARDMPGVLAHDGVQQAHQETVRALHALGALRLYALKLNGNVIATYYGLLDARGLERRAYYYLGGFDPEHKALSPGTLLIHHAIQEAVEEGAVSFDFLRGQEKYKYLWGAEDTPTVRRQLWHTAREERA
jgi:CelD/BcsL family acetyltransferase involved in cellulose biosynthesis